MLMPHAGLDISDDGISAISYSGFGGTRHVSSYGRTDIPAGLLTGGDIKDESEFISRLRDFGKKNSLKDVKVSVPEEKAYLFQTDVPSTDQKTIEQNIEFKLEENVPLSGADAVFYFDLLPNAATGGSLRASVSVVPRTYIEHYMSLLESAGLRPISFETAPKALARAVIPSGSDKTRLLIHVMSKKTGMYLVSGNVIHFTLTSSWGSAALQDRSNTATALDFGREIDRVRAYWLSRGTGKDVEELLLISKDAEKLEPLFNSMAGGALTVRIADVWCNATNLEKYIPPISRAESLEYAVAAGLAFDTPRSA